MLSREDRQEIYTLAKFHGVDIETSYIDGQVTTERYVSLEELSQILFEVSEEAAE